MKKVLISLLCIAIFISNIFLISSCSTNVQTTSISTPIETIETTIQTTETTNNETTQNIETSEIEINYEWTIADNPNITSKEKSIVDSYIRYIDGIGIQPVVNVASKEVDDGYEYLLLCLTFPVMPNANKSYTLVCFHQEKMMDKTAMVYRKGLKKNTYSDFAFVPTYNLPTDCSISEDLYKEIEPCIGKRTPIAVVEENYTKINDTTEYVILCEEIVDNNQQFLLLFISKSPYSTQAIATIYFN